MLLILLSLHTSILTLTMQHSLYSLADYHLSFPKHCGYQIFQDNQEVSPAAQFSAGIMDIQDLSSHTQSNLNWESPVLMLKDKL